MMNVLNKSTILLTAALSFLCQLTAIFPAANAFAGYELVWRDDFDGTTLNATNWTIGLRDTATGDLVPGAAGQYLLNSEYEGYITAADVVVGGGTLNLLNQKRAYHGNSPAGNYDYTSGWVMSLHKVHFNKGHLEWRARFPVGVKVWPALWLIAEDLVWGPEWDCFEYFGYRSDVGYDAMGCHLLRDEYPNQKWSSQWIKPFHQTYNATNWHVYGFEWTATNANWFVDGVRVKTLNNTFGASWPNEEMYLVMNNGVRTSSPDTNTAWPNTLEIDYVALFQVVPDTNAPAILSLSPANGATNIAVGANLSATFNEGIRLGTGNITIKNLTDAIQTTIAITNNTQVSISGTTLIINPAANLLPARQYAIQIAPTAITDMATNAFPGILNDLTWSFTTEPPDLTAPTIVNFSPANGATGVAADANLVATFSEPIVVGDGDLTLTNLTDATQITIAVTNDALVSVAGSVLAINPPSSLLAGKQYALQMDPGVVSDMSDNPFAGIANDTTWSFTIAPPPSGALIHEPFATQTVGSNLNNQAASTTGLTGNWKTTLTSAMNITSGNLGWGSLPVTGNQAQENANSSFSAYVTNATGALETQLGDSANLWFSLVVTTPGDIGTNPDLGFGIGNNYIGNGNNLAIDGGAGNQAVGFRIKSGSLRAAWWNGGTVNPAGSGKSVAANTTNLIVGHITWGAAGGNENIDLYTPDTNLNLGSIVSTVTTTTNLSESGFKVISFGRKATGSAGGLVFDEIRFGASYASVIGSGGGVSTNANLTSLVLSPAGTLSPAFNSNVFSYTATEAYGTSPTVTVVNADLTATNHLIYNGATNLLASGVASSPLPLALGAVNPVVVRVTAPDGVTMNTYTINVTMLPSLTQPTLSSSASGGVLTLSWPSTYLGYTLQVKTNALDAGLNGGTWNPVAGSALVTATNLPITTTTPTTFYRLVYP